jgi:hypothetical protein
MIYKTLHRKQHVYVYPRENEIAFLCEFRNLKRPPQNTGIVFEYLHKKVLVTSEYRLLLWIESVAINKELELAVVSLSCSGVKGSCQMVTAVEQDGLPVVILYLFR